jgi:hypothetical protein
MATWSSNAARRPCSTGSRSACPNPAPAAAITLGGGAMRSSRCPGGARLRVDPEHPHTTGLLCAMHRAETGCRCSDAFNGAELPSADSCFRCPACTSHSGPAHLLSYKLSARKARSTPASAPRPVSGRPVLARSQEVASIRAAAIPPAVALPVSDNLGSAAPSRSTAALV